MWAAGWAPLKARRWLAEDWGRCQGGVRSPEMRKAQGRAGETSETPSNLKSSWMVQTAERVLLGLGDVLLGLKPMSWSSEAAGAQIMGSAEGDVLLSLSKPKTRVKES